MTAPATLLIDTSGTRLALALAREGGPVDSLVHDIAKGHAEALFGAIGALLARNSLGYADLGRVAALCGPGSFTGLRVGLSAARGLALARAIPALGIPNLLALSLSHEGPSYIVLDAKRGQAYRQAFSAPGTPLDAPELIDLDTALAQAGRDAPDAPFCDIERTARFAARAEPALYPPVPLYIRAADAKPQTRGKVARR